MLKNISLFILLQVALVLNTNAQCIEGNCYESNGTFQFENGDQYKGQWKKGVPNGYGAYEFVNGDDYKGNFKEGLMDGRGTYKYNNGDKYIGTWKQGKMNGRGHFHWDLPGDLMTNAKYEGFFKEGVAVNLEIPATGMPADPPKNK